MADYIKREDARDLLEKALSEPEDYCSHGRENDG